MDADASDATAGVGDSLNGETKPDPAKLAQSAIIKQDVMLSGTSTQSPVSSVLTMPSVSMPTVSMSTGSIASTMASLTGALPDNLFLSTVPNDTGAANPLLDAKDFSAALGHPGGLASQPQQLLGQPQVAAPQIILTAGQAALGGQGSQASLPVQQILIPVSTGNGTQQLLSIPVSLATNSNTGQIQLLTTSNGQIIATNLNNLTQQINVSPLGLGAESLAAPASLAAQNQYIKSPLLNNAAPSHSSMAGIGAAAHTSTTAASALATHVAPHSSVTTATAQNSATPQIAGLTQLITNAQGQILAIGTPQAMPASVPTQSSTLAQSSLAQAIQTTGAATAGSYSQSVATEYFAGNPLLSAGLPAAPVSVSQASQAAAISQSAVPTINTAQLASAVAPHVVAPASQTNGGAISTTTTANINQLLPSHISVIADTVSNSTESTTVDGINLDEIKEFAKQFKIRRLSLGLTQTQVGQALSATEGPSYSQSAICRFEKLDITPKSAQKIKPVLERWMLEAEERYKNGMQNLTDFIGSEPSKKRKRRTSFTPQALEVLNEHFERNTHPSGAEMTELSEKLNLDREVIRVWFCNKRQTLKNTIKKLKTQDVTMTIS